MIAGVEVEEPGGGGGGSKSGATGRTEFPQAEIDSIMREIEAYRVLREANYNEELAQIETLKQEYSLKLKAVAGNCRCRAGFWWRKEIERLLKSRII